jgi:hypothetical protein
MRTRIALLLLLATVPLAAQNKRYHFQSNPWVNLHQRLLYAAQLGPSDPAPQWKEPVEAYRKLFGKRSPLADQQLMLIDDVLPTVTSDRLPDTIPAPVAKVLKSAMPMYRATQWPIDDRANRFWIAIAETLLAQAGEELIAAHEKVYGVPFPTNILVDVTSDAWMFGAYTMGEGANAHSFIASPVSGTQGFGALESLMHEPSHAIVSGRSGAIGADLVRLQRELNVKVYANLWHAILFYTSGELTRRALAARGVTYRPFIEDMYGGPFKGMRESLETHWKAYMDGKKTREEALRQIVIETAIK